MQIKKAILTGGGRATRLRPITTTINKHLIPLANRPMIFHAIEKVVKAGVTEIFINTNPGETELQQVVGDGRRWGVKIRFFEQTGGPQGIAHVVKEAQPFIGDDPFIYYLSDNIILSDINQLADKFNSGSYDCLLALSQVPDPERFGVPVFDADGKLTEVLEKPKSPPNNFAVTGIYLFGPKLFFEAFKHIEKSARGEYEIPSVLSWLIKEKYRVGYEEITGWWKDTGKPEDLILANRLLMENAGAKNILGKNVRQSGQVKLVEPFIVGDDCELKDCVVGPYVSVGRGSVIGRAQITNSIVFENCQIDAPVKISDSLIGRGATIRQNGAAGFHRLILGDNTVVEM